MKNITALTAAGLLAAGSVLAGCSPTTEKPSTATGDSTPTVWTGSPAPAASGEEGHGGGSGQSGESSHSGAAGKSGAEAPKRDIVTLNQYIVDNKIAEVPFKKGDPGAPDIEFPIPPGWTAAGDQKPDWAYGAIFYDKMVARNESTYMYAIASKLTGNVDPEKILELAPGQLDVLPEFEVMRGPKRAKFSGYDSVEYIGTFVDDGKSRAVGQETVVIPGKDAVYVLQLNGEAPAGEGQVVIDAAAVIRDQTKITLPS
ncbi:LpqN/LpqT family lipoprotein [Mycolicibacterium sp.]|uniref:LpqN/LpqT family lipoprotein n=1 Tax=Mycolicibacterium sp. TaxID=2320850 RepID=UPI0028A90F45|nr:LpqN/LpqT family lipoprotein [Mycolicibacterium sp.]